MTTQQPVQVTVTGINERSCFSRDARGRVVAVPLNSLVAALRGGRPEVGQQSVFVPHACEGFAHLLGLPPGTILDVYAYRTVSGKWTATAVHPPAPVTARRPASSGTGLPQP